MAKITSFMFLSGRLISFMLSLVEGFAVFPGSYFMLNKYRPDFLVYQYFSLSVMIFKLCVKVQVSLTVYTYPRFFPL